MRDIMRATAHCETFAREVGRIYTTDAHTRAARSKRHPVYVILLTMASSYQSLSDNTFPLAHVRSICCRGQRV